MTLATEACTTTVIADGVSRTFNYSFRIPSKAEADLYLRDSSGAVTLLDPASWSITGTGPDGTGGTFTYPLSPVAVLAAGLELTLARDVPYTQTTQLTNQSSYSPRTVERGFDRIEMQIQQLANVADRSVRVSITDGPIDDLPSLIERLGKVIGFDPVTGAIALFPVPTPASGSEPDGYANVKDYGAVGDGTNDDTTAFQTAAATGLSLWVPPGSYKLTDTINFTFAGQGMVGIDAGASVLLPVGTGFDLLNVLSSNAVFRDFGINGLYYDTGYPFAINGSSNVVVQRVSGPNLLQVMTADNVTALQVIECYVYDAGAPNSTLVELKGTTESKDCVFRDCGFIFVLSTGEAYLNGTSMHINGNVSGTLISNLSLGNGNQGLRVSNDVGAPAAPSALSARDVIVRHTRQEGINIVEGSDLIFLGSQVDEIETKSGVLIGAATTGVYVGGSVSNCRRYGVETETGAASATVDLSSAEDNGMGPYSIPNGAGSDLNFLARGGANVDAPMIVPGFAILGCNGFGAEVELTLLAGQVTAATVTRQGYGYAPIFPSTTLPALVVSGDGAGCVLVPTVSAEGRITSVAVSAPGAGYTWAVCRVDAENVAQQVLAYSPLFPGTSSTFRADGDGSVKLGNGRGLGLEIFVPANPTMWPQVLGGTVGDMAKVTVVAPGVANADIILYGKGAGSAILGLSAGKVGFFQATGAVKQTVTGSRGGNAALASLLTALAAYGIITDGSTP